MVRKTVMRQKPFNREGMRVLVCDTGNSNFNHDFNYRGDGEIAGVYSFPTMFNELFNVELVGV